MLLLWGQGKGGFMVTKRLLLDMRAPCNMVLHIVLQGGDRETWSGGLGEEVACPGERSPGFQNFHPLIVSKPRWSLFQYSADNFSPLLSSTLKPSEDPLCRTHSSGFYLFIFLSSGPSMSCLSHLPSHVYLKSDLDQPTSLRWS